MSRAGLNVLVRTRGFLPDVSENTHKTGIDIYIKYILCSSLVF